MSDKQMKAAPMAAVNATVLAVVIVLAGAVYFVGSSMSGEKPQLTRSVAGDQITDTRDLPE